MLVGVLRRQSLEAAWQSGERDEAVLTMATDQFVHLHPDHSLEVVLDRLAQSDGVVPVVSRTNVKRVEGVVTAQSLFRPVTTRRA